MNALRKHTAGFTVIELLVAISALFIVFMFFFALYSVGTGDTSAFSAMVAGPWTERELGIFFCGLFVGWIIG